MSEDSVIAAGKDWLEILNLYRQSGKSDTQQAQDMKRALLRMVYVRFEREYRAYWEQEMKTQEAARRLEDEVAELLGTKS